MSNKDYKAFIVEGTVREPQIIKNISNIFFSDNNFKIITLPAGENIYMLWNKLKKDDFDTDIIELLRENNADIREQLSGLLRDDFSEVYLFFDYDSHQKNIGRSIDVDIIEQMLNSFDNETENGKLYISYPMVEALKDYNPGVCGKPGTCYAATDTMKKYKEISGRRSSNAHIKNYKYEDWKNIIDVFAMRVSCLFGTDETMDYKQYCKYINPCMVYNLEKQEATNKRVFILSAFPEFLIDYFGIKLWKNCSRHKNHILDCPHKK